MRPNFVMLGMVAGLVVLVADQISKWWVLNVLDLPELRQVVVLPVLNLTMVWNHGVTFGLLNGLGSAGHIFLAVIALAVVAALGLWLRKAESILGGDTAIGAIAGGAIGNVIDRVRYGAVVDFIHAHIASPWGDLSWYVFNVADAAIVCGVGALILNSQFIAASAGTFCLTPDGAGPSLSTWAICANHVCSRSLRCWHFHWRVSACYIANACNCGPVLPLGPPLFEHLLFTS